MYAARPEISVARYKLTREVPTLREAEIASVARYERLFTRYLLGHFDDHIVRRIDRRRRDVAPFETERRRCLLQCFHSGSLVLLRERKLGELAVRADFTRYSTDRRGPMT